MTREWDDYGEPRDRDYGRGRDAGYRGSGYLGGDWPGGRDYEPRSFRGRGPKNYRRSDERIREDVCDHLTLDHDIDASDIDVRVEGNTVTLDGTVSDLNTKRRAERIAESIRGVGDVFNNLRVSRP